MIKTRPSRKKKRKPRKERRDIEHQSQKEFFDWCRRHPDRRLNYVRPDLSGMPLTPGVVIKAKEAGMIAGTPDVSMPIPNKFFHGLFIEFKSPTGELSPAQEDYRKFCEYYGYAYHVCRSSLEAVLVVEEYLETSKPFD